MSSMDVSDANPSRSGSMINQDTEVPEDRRPSYVEKMVRQSSIQGAIALTEVQFVAINNHFQKFMDDTEGDENLQLARAEMSSLLHKFRTTFTVQSRLVAKVKELTMEKEMKEKEDDEMYSLSMEREEEVQSLKLDLEKMREDYGDVVRQKQEALGQMESLKLKMAEQKKKAEGAPSTPVASEGKQLMKLREEMIMERTSMQQEISELTKNLDDKVEDYEEQQQKLEEATKSLTDCRNSLTEVRGQLQMESRRRGKTDREILDIRTNLREKEDSLKKTKTELTETKTSLDYWETRSKKYEEESRKNQKDLDLVSTAHDKLKRDFEVRGDKLAVITSQRDGLLGDIKEKQTEIRCLKSEIAVLSKEKFAASKRVASLEGHRTQAEDKVQLLKTETAALEKEIEEARSELVIYQKQIHDLLKEKDLLTAKIERGDKYRVQLMTDIKVKDEAKKVLNQELLITHSRLDDQKKLVKDMGIEKTKMTNEVQRLLNKISNQEGEIQIYEASISDYKKEVVELGSQLEEEKQLNEEKTDDIYNYVKIYKKSQADLAMQKIIAGDLRTCIGQLRDTEKVNAFERAELMGVKAKLETDITHLRAQLEKQVLKVAEARELVHRKDQQIKSLSKDIVSKNKDLDCTKKWLAKMTQDRNILGTQLLRRNCEMTLLNQKLKIQENTLTRGEHEYHKRVDDIKLLKQELLRLARTQGFLKKKVCLYSQLRQELIQTQQTLMQEKLRSKALEAEMQQPMNVHRWRLLAGADPERYQLIYKNQYLQKKLITKTTMLDHKETELQEQQKLVEELRELLKKQPSHNIVDELRMYKTRILKQRDKMDSLSAQVNMYSSYFTSFKAEIARLKDELNQFKKAEYNRKLKARN